MNEEEAKKIYDEEVGAFETATQRLKDLLESMLEDLSSDYGVREGSWVSGEAKKFDSFFEKARDPSITDRDNCLKRVHDFGRARVVVQTVDDVYRLKEMLEHQEFLAPDWGNAEDYIKKPKDRGYRSYHVDVGVEIPVSGKKRTVKCELQIRSAIQHAWSGFSHKDFYKGLEIPAVYADQMAEMSNLLASVDRMGANLIERLNAEREKANGSPNGTDVEAPPKPPD